MYNTGHYDRTADLLMSAEELITLRMIFEANIPLDDKYWFLCRKLANREQNQQIAITVAEIVLPLYENRYPDNKAPRECIEAGKQYLAGNSSLAVLSHKRKAAYDAAEDASADADVAAEAALDDATYADSADTEAAANAAYAIEAVIDVISTSDNDYASSATTDVTQSAIYAADAYIDADEGVAATFGTACAEAGKKLKDYLMTFIE